MKRSLFLASVLVLMLAANCFAVGAGVGIRSMGMGGTGIATSNDITAAYFNPAGLMSGPENFEFQTYAGGTGGQIQALADAAEDPDYLSNNFDEDLNITAKMNAQLGISVKKVGISLLADARGVFFHPANSVSRGLIYAQAIAMTPLTLGSTFSTPGLPVASMSVGVNLKPIQIFAGGVEVSSTVPGTGTRQSTTGTGFGFDIGMQTKITPFVTLGAVIRNLSASYTTTTKTQNITVAPDGTFTDVGAETQKKTTDTLAPETGIGVGVSIPLIGTLIAADAENYSVPGDKSYDDFHLGIEQGMLANLVMLRLGYYTDGPAEDTFYTYGIGLNMGPATIGIAAANSSKDSVNSVSSAQLGVAF
jgi:hypothetical protein